LEEEIVEQQKELSELLEHLERKLDYTRRLIAEYDETMDFASQCNLQGFAQGIEFAIEEIKEIATPPKAGDKAGKRRKNKDTRVSMQAKVAVKSKARTKVQR
jgi:hypothetical protein